MPRGEQFKLRFPGLIPEATELWRRWLVEYEAEFLRFEYNVAVGQGIAPPAGPVDTDPELDRRLKERWTASTRKRIDVVGTKATETWVIEVDIRPGARTLGQLILYEQLLPETRPGIGQLTLALICQRLGPDMRSTFESQGVVIFQLPA